METQISQTSNSEKYIDDHDDHSALMLAALEGNTVKVQALLSDGVNVNAKDSAGRTALMFAVINMHYETVGVLLSHGADVNSRAVDGGTALILAASSGDPKIVGSRSGHTCKVYSNKYECHDDSNQPPLWRDHSIARAS